MQDENMGDDGDEAYGNDEETKDTESRSVNQIVNGKEENSKDFDDGDDKQSIREQKVIEDKAERSQDEEINTQEVVALEANDLDNESNVKSEKRDENDEVKGECENSFEMDKEQQNKGDSEEKVNPDTDVDKQKGLILDIDSSNNDENEKSDKRDENYEVKGGCEHSIEMEKEQPNERDLEGESCQDTGIEKEETVNTESDNFVSNEKNKNFEQCDNSLDFDKDQQKENELEDKGDNIEEYIDINEEASSEKLQKKTQ